MDSQQYFEQQKKRFLLYASHSLQTPLMIISGYAQAIQQNLISPEEAARVILDQSGKLSHLSDKLLLFSGLDDRAANADLSPCSLSEAVAKFLERSVFVSGENRIRFSPLPAFPLRGNCPRAHTGADEVSKPSSAIPNDLVPIAEDLLELILDNLITNALRYAKDSVLVSIREEGSQLCLDVADDGDGIPEEAFPYLFDLFYKGRDGQHGLGLPLALEAAKYMGAELTAANRPEGGAVFTLRLQRA